MAGLRGGERERDGLQVAQLADGDDVGVLAQGAAQGAGEGAGVGAHLALVDHARFERWMYSIGSSMVMMWSARSP